MQYISLKSRPNNQIVAALLFLNIFNPNLCFPTFSCVYQPVMAQAASEVFLEVSFEDFLENSLKEYLKVKSKLTKQKIAL